MQTCQKPADELYIYYLEGRVRTRDEAFGEHFIGNWEEDGHTFLFFSRPHDRIVAQLIAGEPQLNMIDQYRMSYADWHGNTIRPFSVGRITVVPPWFEGESTWEQHKQTGIDGVKDQFRVVLDPGVVFGTGTHPTTRACLEALDLIYRMDAPEVVLDVGTGTGLLAIAAAKLGAGPILGAARLR